MTLNNMSRDFGLKMKNRDMVRYVFKCTKVSHFEITTGILIQRVLWVKNLKLWTQVRFNG